MIFLFLGGEGGEGANTILIPAETVHIYGDVFGSIAIASVVAAVICFALSTLLKKWMHEGV